MIKDNPPPLPSPRRIDCGIMFFSEEDYRAGEAAAFARGVAAASKAQAQAGEPEVVAYGAITDYGEYEVRTTRFIANGDELITLQSHREAMADMFGKWERACEQSNQWYEQNEWLREAVAKKDAALQACVEAWESYMKQYPHMTKGYMMDAIQQAQEALK